MSQSNVPKHLDVQVVSPTAGNITTMNGESVMTYGANGQPIPGSAPAGGAAPWSPVVVPQQPSVIVVTVGQKEDKTPKGSSEVFKRL